MPMIITKPLYTAEVSTTGGREGHAKSSDGVLDLALTKPGAGKGTNPEQLMAAGWSACYQSAVQAIAKRDGLDASKSVVTVKVTLGNDETGSYGLKAEINLSVPGLALEQVQTLAKTADEMCPYSKATRGNIEVAVNAVPNS
ncbi:organic hydroperoxide resistance protein [soil metagenome]